MAKPRAPLSMPQVGAGTTLTGVICAAIALTSQLLEIQQTQQLRWTQVEARLLRLEAKLDTLIASGRPPDLLPLARRVRVQPAPAALNRRAGGPGPGAAWAAADPHGPLSSRGGARARPLACSGGPRRLNRRGPKRGRLTPLFPPHPLRRAQTRAPRGPARGRTAPAR